MTTFAILGIITAAMIQGPSSVQPDEHHSRARQTIEQVLDEPEFRGLEPKSSWLMDWLRSIGEWFRDAVESIPGWLAWVLLVWMILTLLAIVAHLIYTLIMLGGGLGGGAAGGGRSVTRRHEGQVFGVTELEYESVISRAQQLMVQGLWSSAVRHLYVASLLWLDQQRLVRFRVSKTNRDYLRELQSQSQVREHSVLVRLTGLFEPSIYGGTAADETTCRRMHSLLKELTYAGTSARQI